MTSHTLPSRPLTDLRRDLERMKDTIRLMQEQRERVREHRRRKLLMIGCGISMVCHLLLMVYLAMVHRAGGGGGGVGPAFASYEFAILNDEELTNVEEASFDQLETDAANNEDPMEALLSPDVGASSAAPSTDPALGASGSGDGGGLGLGASGDGGEGLGLGGGGGGTSFFGIGSKGTRFAFIVDVSGSMGERSKIHVAMGELARAVDSLPDFAHLFIVLFESGPVLPPMQQGWMRAKKPYIRQVVRWLGEVDPNGGTQPRAAFLHVFALEARPDVIYFLTDGQFNDITPDEIAALNGRGKKAVINTIQFGDPGGQEVLRTIANQSGGIYRFVSAGNQ